MNEDEYSIEIEDIGAPEMTQSEQKEKIVNTGADVEMGNRYRLWRVWAPEALSVLWVMLNPSVADAGKDDATIRRCIGFAKRWGYGGIEVVNLYSVISTDPRRLRDLGYPNGPRADAAIHDVLTEGTVGMVVYAWGNGGMPSRARQIDDLVTSWGFDPKCLGHTKSGRPRHPVRLGYDTKLVSYRAPWRSRDDEGAA